MKKYKLIKEYPGSPKAGTIGYLVMGESVTCFILPDNSKIFSSITIIDFEEFPEYWKTIIEEPLFYTSEDEIYYDGLALPVYKGDEIYIVNNDELLPFIATIQIKTSNSFKAFKTLVAAQDYIILQKAIKESELKIGDPLKLINTPSFNIKSYPKYNSWSIVSSWLGTNYKVEDFFILYGIPAIKTCDCFLVPISDYSKAKLFFGNKEVELKLVQSTYKDIDIICSGETSKYSSCKKFRDAITTIQEFKFGTREVEYMMEKIIETYPRRIKIGCTIGALEEIDKILKECEKLLV